MGIQRGSKGSQRKSLYILAIGLAIVLGVTGCQMAGLEADEETIAASIWQDEALATIPMKGSDYLVQPGSSWEPFKIYREVKGIYMTGNTIGLQWRFEQILHETNQSIINAWVVDVRMIMVR